MEIRKQPRPMGMKSEAERTQIGLTIIAAAAVLLLASTAILVCLGVVDFDYTPTTRTEAPTIMKAMNK